MPSEYCHSNSLARSINGLNESSVERTLSAICSRSFMIESSGTSPLGRRDGSYRSSRLGRSGGSRGVRGIGCRPSGYRGDRCRRLISGGWRGTWGRPPLELFSLQETCSASVRNTGPRPGLGPGSIGTVICRVKLRGRSPVIACQWVRWALMESRSCPLILETLLIPVEQVVGSPFGIVPGFPSSNARCLLELRHFHERI